MALKPWNPLYCCILRVLWACRYVNYFPRPACETSSKPWNAPTLHLYGSCCREDSQEYTVYYLPTNQFIYSIIGRAWLLQEYKWSICKSPSPPKLKGFSAATEVCAIQWNQSDGTIHLSSQAAVPSQGIKMITWEIFWMADKLHKSSSYITKNIFQ